jgi:hypothetical protein
VVIKNLMEKLEEEVKEEVKKPEEEVKKSSKVMMIEGAGGDPEKKDKGPVHVQLENLIKE